MITGLYALFDVKAASYSPPMAFSTVGLARRSIEDEMSRSDSVIARHPADYDLRHIADYDTSTGIVKSLREPSVVCKASDFSNQGALHV